ncbi:unnamed protein product [Rotaria magnacalcarata]|uniref:Uncharacterized protein n=4 Tax=Rotaria magnacalcarata TaxID=392030 RepID=A0A816H0J9_9BILA|nr:unnamed protein product [Rotaria magnacalcarata]
MNADDKCELTRTMLMHQSSSLRSIVLQYTYDYSNVASLHLYLDGSPSIVSVLSVIAILRLYHRVRYLHIILKDNSPVDDTNIYVPITIPTVNKNDLPVLSQVISFGLTLFAAWNNDSVACILRCIPNLNHLKNLSYLKVDYFEDTSLDNPFSRENIIEKRRQAFPMMIIINEQLVNVKNDGEITEI